MKRIIKKLIPVSVKRYLMENWRRSGKMPPVSVRNLMAYDGTFTLDVEGNPLKLSHTNRWIENELFWKGLQGYEPASVQVWLAAAKRSHTVVDVGANTGFFSLLAKRVNPAAVVYSFEPLPLFRDIFIENKKINGFDIQICPYAVSDFEGDAKFYVPQENQGNLYASSLSLEHYKVHQDTKPNEVDVQVKIFDTWAQHHGVSGIDLVKIDAEGHDPQVLRGMRETIQRDRPDFLIEVQNDAVAEQIMAALSAPDYCYFEVDDAKGVCRVDRIKKSSDYNFFVCKQETAQALPILMSA